MFAVSRPGPRFLPGPCLLAALFAIFSLPIHAVVVSGLVRDPLGRAIPGAQVFLVQKGVIIARTLVEKDGSYQITSGASGRFYVFGSYGKFKQMNIQSFYAGAADGRQQNIFLEPPPVQQEVVSAATRTPTPQAQLSTSVSVERNQDFANRQELADALRRIPGVFVLQKGQYGALTSLYVRGGSPDSNQVNLDGNSLNDIGGAFDLSSVTPMGIEKLELARAPNSALYGTDAATSVLNFTTPRGSTPFTSLIFDGDYGDLTSFRDQIQAAGMLSRADYYAGFTGFQSSNNLPMDQYHNYTPSANLSYSNLTAGTQLRVTARNSVSAVGTPGAFDFYGLADAGKRSDQDTYMSGTLDSQTSPDWHNTVTYGLTRKREEDQTFYAAGVPIETQVGGRPVTNYYGLPTVTTGANGYSVSGRAVMNYAGTSPNTLESVSNRDQLYFQSTYQFSPHLTGLTGFRFEDERGAEKSPVDGLYQTLERANYDYSTQLQGSYHSRVYYTLGGGVEKNNLFGTVGTPHIGLVYYPSQPSLGFHGTKLTFDYASGYSEPSLKDQFGSLYTFLEGQSGGSQAIQQLRVSPMRAQDSRVFDVGVEQNFMSQRGVVRIHVYHNQYRNQVESVPATEVPALLPNLSQTQQQKLENYLIDGPGIDLNSLAYRSQGVESEVRFTLSQNLLLRGAYTYVDSVVQNSFTSDALSPSFNTGPPGGPAPSFANIPIGNMGPLRGARPFNRPPHIGSTTVTYNHNRISAIFTGAFVSRSDDSTFLGGMDLYGGNSLLLPNRNLDHSYTKLNAETTYQYKPQLQFYAQFSNLTDDRHVSPIGNPSLPFTFRVGMHIPLGHK